MVNLSAHAIERYLERVRPTLPNFAAAKRDLEALVTTASWVEMVPWWHKEKPPGGFLLLSDGIAVLLNHSKDLVVTCVVRGDVPEAQRELRRRRKQRRRQHLRHERNDEKHGREGRRRRNDRRRESEDV